MHDLIAHHESVLNELKENCSRELNAMRASSQTEIEVITLCDDGVLIEKHL
jgi:hypothetical protein